MLSHMIVGSIIKYFIVQILHIKNKNYMGIKKIDKILNE